MYPYEIIGLQMDALYKAGYDAAKNAAEKNDTLEEVADVEATKEATKSAMEDMDCWSVNEHLKECGKHEAKKTKLTLKNLDDIPCEKCGTLTTRTLVGDEWYQICRDCDWVTHN